METCESNCNANLLARIMMPALTRPSCPQKPLSLTTLGLGKQYIQVHIVFTRAFCNSVSIIMRREYEKGHQQSLTHACYQEFTPCRLLCEKVIFTYTNDQTCLRQHRVIQHKPLWLKPYSGPNFNLKSVRFATLSLFKREVSKYSEDKPIQTCS